MIRAAETIIADTANIDSKPDTTGSEQLIRKLLAENQVFDQAFHFNIWSECRSFLKFTSAMLLAFPAGLYMRSRIRKNKRLNHILQFKELLPVRNNIEKGSFAYDTILFKQSAFQLLKNKSHLANLVCLAILFGDEFIDGIAESGGRDLIRRLLHNSDLNYYLQYRKTDGRYELYYEFDICEVLPDEVLESINKKYEITYKAFYSHLQFLLSEMNLHLNTCDAEQAAEAAQLICRVCNRCFDTYKADIYEYDELHSLEEMLQYQKTKDEDIIQILLTLRAVLLGKKQLQYQQFFGSWGSMVRNMQLYDDMQDVAHDCGFQMNMPVYFARNFFTDEWVWLQRNKEYVQTLHGIHLHFTIASQMPGSCILTYQFARHITHSRLCWVQRKIQNYLWRKNWLGFNNPALAGSGVVMKIANDQQAESLLPKLRYIKQQSLQVDSDLITNDQKWAFMIDLALLDPEPKQFLLRKTSRVERYQLLSCYLEFPVYRKANLAKRIFENI